MIQTTRAQTTRAMHLLGYTTKTSSIPAGWSANPDVQEICSVSTCLTTSPDWNEPELQNEFRYYNTRADALSLEQPVGFNLFAYRLLPIRFTSAAQEAMVFPTLEVEPLPANVTSLGFDVVNWGLCDCFGCSPLSCNGMAREVIGVNGHCLMGSLEDAIALAEQFSLHPPEPGDHFVLEVLRLPL
jgi:hypothetical protein